MSAALPVGVPTPNRRPARRPPPPPLAPRWRGFFGLLGVLWTSGALLSPFLDATVPPLAAVLAWTSLLLAGLLVGAGVITLAIGLVGGVREALR